MVRPIVELTEKGKTFIWDAACDRPFVIVKKALISSEVMGYPLNDAGEFVLDVDASDIGIGGILHQVQGERERVIAYASRSLNGAERNYCITEKELLAVRFFIECYEMKCITRVSSKLIHQLIVGKYGTSSICSPRTICDILSRFYHEFAEKSTSYLQLSDFILLSI